MTWHRSRHAAIIVLVLLVSACASRPIISSAGNDDAWSLNGRIGINAGSRHGSFTVDWLQRPGHFEINLLGPLGMGVARVTGDPGRVVLDVPGQAPVVADSPDSLLKQAVGVDIPVTPLRYWVRGKPAPGPHRSTADGFHQFGWQVAYLRYEKQLPVKIRLTRPEVKVMMVVKQWAK